jgi:hypothetical protein
VEPQKDVVIISAFGRGFWLAQELVNEGLSVNLVDVTESMGRWAPEDGEGPFGLFQSARLLPSQLNCLAEQDVHDSVERGFSIWLKDGPFDLKGPLYEYHLKQKKFSSKCLEYLRQSDTITADQQKRLLKALNQEKFEDNWLAALAHQLATTGFEFQAQAFDYGEPVSLFAPYSIRRVTRGGWENLVRWAETRGVNVIRSASVQDLVHEGKILKGIEVKTKDSSRVLSGRYFIWTLSSEETRRFGERVEKKLFPEMAIESTWCWVRYRLEVDIGPDTQALPLKFLMIEDLYLPWTHTNFCIIERTVKETQLDAWIRIPTQHRFQRSYLENRASEMTQIFSHRLPNSKARCSLMPQDYYYEYEELGPPRFPVFDIAQKENLHRWKLKNLFFDGPEIWLNHDWVGRFQGENSILAQIQKLQRKLKSSGSTGSKGEKVSDQSLHP